MTVGFIAEVPLANSVEVVGRPIPRLAIQIPVKNFEIAGYEEIVPLVCREDKDHKSRQGLLFNRGWIPYQVRHPTVRPRIEDVTRQKFTCFVSQLSELNNKDWFNGNAYQPGRVKYNCADLQDMAKSS